LNIIQVFHVHYCIKFRKALQDFQANDEIFRLLYE